MAEVVTAVAVLTLCLLTTDAGKLFPCVQTHLHTSRHTWDRRCVKANLHLIFIANHRRRYGLERTRLLDTGNLGIFQDAVHLFAEFAQLVFLHHDSFPSYFIVTFEDLMDGALFR